jgi:hypothetical protein
MSKYARVGAPFNFLGHMSLDQKNAFYSWLDSKKANFAPIQEFHQIRSQQLRKTAGLLEDFYASEKLKPSFAKAPWEPGPQGYFPYTQRDDQQPAVLVQRIKERVKEQLQHDDEAVFWMNWLRTHIEKQEDMAQIASEASAEITALKKELDALFDGGTYDAVLVKDTKVYRVHQLDDPTETEMKRVAYDASDKNGYTIKMPEGV